MERARQWIIGLTGSAEPVHPALRGLIDKWASDPDNLVMHEAVRDDAVDNGRPTATSGLGPLTRRRGVSCAPERGRERCEALAGGGRGVGAIMREGSTYGDKSPHFYRKMLWLVDDVTPR